MKPLFSILLAPTLTLCGTFSGTVVSLDGTPVVGATIKVGTDSVKTTADGTWSLARAAGIASRSGKTIASTSLSASPVTPHLAVENGHPRLSFGGMDISGRGRAHVSSIGSERSLSGAEGSRTAAARSLAASDTLRLYWKGKRLTVLPVPADTGSITFRIDTAWKHDHGIPWNPRIAYGSLLDPRDGQTYRTVAIGSQTWMAENLQVSHDTSAVLGSCRDGNCAINDRMYTWDDAMGGSSHSERNPSGVRGICPEKWHLPSSQEWRILFFISLDSATSGRALKASIDPNAYAPSNGTDQFGFRGILIGWMDRPNAAQMDGDGRFTFWWSTDEGKFYDNQRGILSYDENFASINWVGASRYCYSIRCLKDTP